MLKHQVKLLLNMNLISSLRKFQAIRPFALERKWVSKKIPKYFYFSLSFFQAIFKRWVNNKLIRVNFTLYFGLYSLRSWWQQTLGKTLDLQYQNRAMPHVFERPRVVGNMHFFVSCQAGVENKQLFPPLSSNSPLSKIKIHSLIPLKKDSRLLLYICL